MSDKKTYRGITLKVNPTKEQEELMWKHVNHSRFIYNYMLERYWKALDNGKYIDHKNMISILKEIKNDDKYSFLNEVSRKTLVGKIDDLRETLIKYHNHEIRKPKFKSKKREPKRFPIRYDRMHFNKEKHVKVEKLGYLRISNGTYKNNKSVLENESIKPLNPKCYYDGKYWYISFSIEVDNQYKKEKDNTNEFIGIDLGIKTLATCSNGKSYKNINKSSKVKKLEKKLSRLQRQLSRKYEMNKQGKKFIKTNNIIKLEKEIKLLHRKLSNIRNTYIHTMTKEIVEQYPSEIVIEDLKVSNLRKNKHLSTSISKANWYTIREYLTYKCEDRGILLTIANQYYPSSQTCSNCGNHLTKQDKLSLSQRTYKCSCGTNLDRDLNASINLKNYRYSNWYQNHLAKQTKSSK
ncbi:transposase [Staphylococcus phage vB_SauM-V1SA19]|nr:transposase [Staphylococcus phage vB_SauM-V1SA19]